MYDERDVHLQPAGVTLGAYACLRLFFYLSKMMLDLKSERSIPIHSCTEMTVKNLASLFPIAAKDAIKALQDDVEDSTGKEAHENTAVSAYSFYDDSG
jgi:hypothetical protein